VVEPVVNAVLAHAHEQYRTDLMSKAVVHADAIAGLLVAAALVRPERSESARRESEELEQRAKQERDALEQNILQRLDEAGATLDKANRIAEEALRKAEIQK
jgi:predicted hydrolase (HD superfamily)